MYKLQVVLLPPGALNISSLYGISSNGTDNTQLISHQALPQPISTTSSIQRNDYSQVNQNNSLFLSSFLAPHVTRSNLKKFLHFTKPSSTIFQLSEEIILKCNKIYPNLCNNMEIITLQDSNDCDLDPDFMVRDVFNIDNIVKVRLKNDLEILESGDNNDASVNSIYSMKKRKLDNNTSQVLNNPVLNITKRRPIAFKNSTTTLRISTPLANQIYPPINAQQVNSDYEEDEACDKSILPPPPPQSPPIRISSAIDNKKLKIYVNEDTVSKSETVDPNKSRQQRLASGTPMKSKNMIRTPNKILLSGQKVISEPIYQPTMKIGGTPDINRKITSGMLCIPEPRISEVEQQLKEGPSSPSVNLPARPSRIPMKKPYINIQDEESSTSSGDDPFHSSETNNRIPHRPSSLIRQSSTSIADDNGSPTKQSPLDKNKISNVIVAELPLHQLIQKKNRQSSLERKVKLLTNNDDESRHNIIRKDRFSEDEDEDPNDTVRISKSELVESSFQKSDLLKIIKENKFDLPPRFKNTSQNFEIDRINKDKRPYLTVLNKDIDNSEPDPRNILPQKIQRHAAQRAAQLLSTGQSRKEIQSSSEESDLERSGSDTGIETDETDNNKLIITENNSLKKLNMHPLKEAVVNGSNKFRGDHSTSNNQLKSKGIVNSPIKENNFKTEASVNEKSENLQQDHVSTNVDGSSNKHISPPNITKSSNELYMLMNQRQDLNIDKKLSLNIVGKKHSLKATKELSENMIKSSSPAPTHAKVYMSPEFVETSDEDSENEVIEPNNIHEHSSDSNKPNPGLSQTTKKFSIKKTVQRELDREKDEKEVLKKVKLEETEKKKAEKEANKKAKEEEQLKKKSEQQKKKIELEAIKKAKLEEATKKTTDTNKDVKLRSQEQTTIQNGVNLDKKVVLSEIKSNLENDVFFKSQESGNVLTSDQMSKLNDLRIDSSRKLASDSKFPGISEKSSQGLLSNSIRPSADFLNGDISFNQQNPPNDEVSADESSSEEISLTKKVRRGIVGTPKGVVGSIPSNLESIVQSTQNSKGEHISSNTPTKVPVTQLMDYTSPNISKAAVPSSNQIKGSAIGSRKSLGSLSDLVSRGIPEVKENSTKLPSTQIRSSDSDSSSSDHLSSEESDDSDISSSSTDESNFISARSASKVLNRKKRNSGFASLIKDSKKK